MRRIILIAIFLLMLSGVAAAQGATTLTLGMYHDARSFVSLEVLKVAYGKLGIEAVGKQNPIGRSLVESSRGVLDGEVHRIKVVEEEYPDLIRIPVVMNVYEGVAFSCRSDIKVDGWASLEGYRIGRLIGLVFAEEGLRGIQNVTALPNLDNLFDLLVADRLDVVVYIRGALAQQMKRLKDDRLHVLEPPLGAQHVYHYLHIKHKALVPEITRVLQEMQNNGEIEAIREQTTIDFWENESTQ